MLTQVNYKIMSKFRAKRIDNGQWAIGVEIKRSSIFYHAKGDYGTTRYEWEMHKTKGIAQTFVK